MSSKNVENKGKGPNKANNLVRSGSGDTVRNAVLECLNNLDTGNLTAVNTSLEYLSFLAVATGSPMGRLAFAFADAIGRVVLHRMRGLSRALQVHIPPPLRLEQTEVTRQWFSELCPLLHIAAAAANHAIVAATDGEKHVHIVDLGGASTPQWCDLLALLAARPQGALASLRLTLLNADEGFVSHSATVLGEAAQRLRIPFVFHQVKSDIDSFSPPDVGAALGVERGRALVITCTLQLHRLMARLIGYKKQAPSSSGHGGRNDDDDDDGKNRKRVNPELPTTIGLDKLVYRMDTFLGELRGLSPKLLVLTEQEANHNDMSHSHWDRTLEALDYYWELFNDLEAAGVPRDSNSRAAVEQILLREEILDIVARDGSQRLQRHQKLESWVLQMGRAGFEGVEATSDAFKEATKMARERSGDGKLRKYRVKRENGHLIVCSDKTPMFSVTAWRPAARRIRE